MVLSPTHGWHAWSQQYVNAPATQPNNFRRPSPDWIRLNPVAMRGRADWLTWQLRNCGATSSPFGGLFHDG